MSAFRGDATVMPVADVLELLAASGLDGALEVSTSVGRAALSLRDGAIVIPAPRPRRSGALSSGVLDALLVRGAEVKGRPAAVSVDVLERVVEEQRAQREPRLRRCLGVLQEVLLWPGARYEFCQVAPTSSLRQRLEHADALRVDVRALLLDAARRSDESRRLTRSALEGLTASGPAPTRLLEGDVEGVVLGTLLQTIRAKRWTGMLTVTAGTRRERLCFQDGEAFVFFGKDVDEPESSLLGDSWADGIKLAMPAGAAQGAVREDDLERADAHAYKAPFLDTLLWRGATFRFELDALPRGFVAPGDGDLRVALATDRFLVEAIRLLDDWEAIRRAIGGRDVVLRFRDADAKLRAVREVGPHGSMLTLIDGRRGFEEVVLLSETTRIDFGRVVRELLEDGLLERIGGA